MYKTRKLTSFHKKKELLHLVDLDLNPHLIKQAGLVSVRLPVSLRKLIKPLSTDNWHREHCRTAEAEHQEKTENRSLMYPTRPVGQLPVRLPEIKARARR